MPVTTSAPSATRAYPPIALAPENVSVPVPTFTKSNPFPFGWSASWAPRTPEKVESVPSSPTKNVACAVDVLVTDPVPASEPIANGRPARSSHAPAPSES